MSLQPGGQRSGPDSGGYDCLILSSIRTATQTAPPEIAKQNEAPASKGEAALPEAEGTAAGERQAQLRAIASDLLYWKGGLKVLRQAQLPKWRGCFQWQIEAQIEALQAAYARLRAECAKLDG